MEYILNTIPSFVKPNGSTDMTNTQSEKAPLDVIAASLRRERRRTGLSLTEVARRAGIAKSTLSQLESGTGNPSVETLWAICVALDVPFSRLVDPPRPHIQVIRAHEGPTVAAAEADYLATLLAACPPGARRDIYRIQAEPGHPRASERTCPAVDTWFSVTGQWGDRELVESQWATTSGTRAAYVPRGGNRGRSPSCSEHVWAPGSRPGGPVAGQATSSSRSARRIIWSWHAVERPGRRPATPASAAQARR
jgi:transcriptional regulator with XRE-family HTH domain